MGFGHDLYSSWARHRRNRGPYSNPKKQAVVFEARVGFEPTNDGFANRSVKPLRHRAFYFFMKSFFILPYFFTRL